MSLEVISDQMAAAAILDPIRNRLLAEIAHPASATELSRRTGIARQKINYHLRTLEENGLAIQAESRKWGGITERMMVATASSYVISPEALGPVAADPEQEKDRLSASYLIAVAARIVQEVGALFRLARQEEKHLATLTMDAKIRFSSPAARAEFTRELAEAVTRLAAKYHDASSPEGRDHRLVVAAHPMYVKDVSSGSIDLTNTSIN